MTRASRGFSLIEVVVATTLLGFSLVAAYQVLGTGLRAASSAQDQAKALVIADGLTAQLGSVYPVENGRRTGAALNGFTWVMQITPYDEDVIEPGRRLDLPESLMRLKQIHIEVSGPKGPLLDITTLRLAAAPNDR